MALAGIDETRLRRAFLEEAEDLSQKLGDSLLGLETEHGNAHLINEVFRFTHSLKSESALMGFAVLSELAHRMEDVLGLAREGRCQLDKRVMDSLFAGSDLIAEMMAAIGKGSSDAAFDTSALRADLSAIVSGSPSPVAHAGEPPSAVASAAVVAAPPAAPLPGVAAPAVPSAPQPAVVSLSDFDRLQLAEARDRGEAAYRLMVNVDPEETMKFPRAYLVFYNLELVANVVKVVPPMEGETPDDQQYAHTTILLTSGDDTGALTSAASVDQIASVQIERCDYATLLAPSASPPAAVPAAEQRAEPAGSAAALPAPQTAENPAAQPAPTADEPGKATTPVERTSIRVDTRKLDDLWSFIAELVLHKSQISRLSESLGKGVDVNTVREDLAESFDALDKISNGMQQAMMDTRMIPISVIFSKFPRLVRDLSRKLGKPITLTLSGEDTEIDRGVVEALSDPLTHIIRNSLDHGIEFPEERVRLGKSEKGSVNVAARRQGGNVVIELTDDGRGMDVERIRRKAMNMGIHGAESFTESQLLDLVFLPGFSTKEVVTDVSGRGVGMDVVATRIRGDLKGDVLLRTEPGKGTRVTLVLPLTLTIVNALLVRGDNQFYAIPLTDVDSTAKLLAVEITGEEGKEASLWRDEEIPVYSLGAFFGKGRRRQEEYFAIVVHHGDRLAYLIVDELIEEREVVIKPVDDLLNSTRLFSGVSLLEDGRLVFILDTSFVRREHF